MKHSSLAIQTEPTLQHDLAAKKYLQKNSLLEFANSYVEGLVSVNNLYDFIPWAFDYTAMQPKTLKFTLLWQQLLDRVFNLQSGKAAFKVANEHYDLGNDLFEAMLDSSMSYTCGYWKNAKSLEQAQQDKLELICTKLKLQPGMQVLDIGCGWGNFAEYAAKNFGATVTGLTISRQQAEYATNRCKNLAVQILLRDYKTIGSSFEAKFDKIVSIEMIEAVGKRNLKGFFNFAHKALKAGGDFIFQAISTETLSKYSNPSVDQFLIWILKYIFPNGYLPNITEIMQPSRHQFSLLSVENLDKDYTKTLLAWEKNFSLNWHRISQHYGERFKRKWLFYLFACAHLFDRQLVHVYQILLHKPKG